MQGLRVVDIMRIGDATQVAVFVKLAREEQVVTKTEEFTRYSLAYHDAGSTWFKGHQEVEIEREREAN